MLWRQLVGTIFYRMFVVIDFLILIEPFSQSEQLKFHCIALLEENRFLNFDKTSYCIRE